MEALRGVFCFGLLAMASAAQISTNAFGSRVIKGQVTDPLLNYVTGMVASRSQEHILWMVDSVQGENWLFAVNSETGMPVAWYNITDASNFDWEDLAYGPCADDCRAKACVAGDAVARYCIYIADIGNHGGDGARNQVYMIREPTLPPTQTGVVFMDNVTVVDKLTFSWDEDDAESLMIAPDGRLYLMSKIDHGRAMIVALPDAAWGGHAVLDLSDTGILKIYTGHHDPQSGSISPDGTELIIGCEEDVFYYSVQDGDFINAVNTQVPARVASYLAVDDTEAITWSADGQGFYTYAKDDNQFIYYYPRTNEQVVG